MAWLTALGVAAINAYVLAERRSGFESMSPQWITFIAATWLLPFVVAIAARVLFVRIRAARGVPKVQSAWVPVLAFALACVSMATTVLASGREGPFAGPLTPGDAIRISGPFTLRAASADTRQIAEAGFKNDKTIQDYEVREIVGDDGSLSLLVVTDAALRDEPGVIERIGRGIESASKLTATYETIRDRRVAIAVGETLSIGGWIEEPLGMYVYAVTPTRLHQIIEAILDAPRPAT